MGGGEREMCELANELAARGHEVDFYALPFMMGSKPKVEPQKVLDGVPYHEAWTHKIEADVAYTFYHPLSTLNFRVKGKRIASFHSQAFFMRSVSPSYGPLPMGVSYGTRLIGPLELRAFDAIHTHFPHPTIRHRKIYTIPGWIDTSVFRPSGPKNPEFTVLFSGRALWQKGWDIYVSLAKRMRDVGIKFLYVGGAIRDEFIQSLGFQGNLSALSQIYNNSHVLMDPVRADTFGRVAVESMACGTPVVTTPSSSHKELNLPFVFGTTLEEYEASIRHLRDLWEAGRPYEQLSRECTNAATVFDFKSMITQYEKMFAEVASS
jgi:glycosyltransferase involved in cell wall biosynthesis